MPRIPEDVIERLKSEVSLQRLVEAAGVSLTRRGKDLVGCCPFHEDRTPSFVVSPSKNLWNCLGACGVGGDVVAFVMKAEGVSFRHAVELLRDDYAPSLEGKPAPASRSTAQKMAPFEAGADDRKLLSRVVSFYHETLKASPEAHAYLAKRGLDDGALIERFRLGYANRTLGYRLPAKNRKEGAELRGRLQALGILRESGHEHFSGSLVVPVICPEGGQVTEVYGRKLLGNLRKGTPKHLYLPGPHKGVFNLEAVTASDEVVLCESLIDAMTFWAAGYRHVTAAYGTNGLTGELTEALSGKRVLIAYDRDQAGDRAAKEAAETLLGKGCECFRVLFPKGMDANEYALQVTPARESLGVLLRSAEWMGSSPERASRTGSAGPEADKDSAAPSRPEAQTLHPEEPSRPAAEEEQEPEESASLETDKPSPLAAGPEPEASTGVEDEAPLPTASPVPPGPTGTEAVVSDHEVTFAFGDRHWRVRGLSKNMSYETLRVNVLVRRELQGTASFHVDAFDLYNAKHRASYVAQASGELGLAKETVKGDLARILLKLEALQDEQIRAALDTGPAAPSMTAEEEEDALALLRSPDLLERIAKDAETCGIVGERANVLALYLAAVSRKLEKPLAVLIQSTSAAGKSALMDAVLEFVPEEEGVQYAAMTGQALFYLGETAVKHKVLAIAEEEGAREASYALKLLQSQGDLSIASTGKDPVTGKLVTQDYRVEGPVALAMTTTAIDLDEELKNRCLVLTVNEGREQTAAIHDRQRYEETLEGLLSGEDRRAIVRRHQNAQRLLRPLKVVNPYAEALTFLADKTRTRRDHRKYLGLIRAIAFLNQHQRPIKTAVVPSAETQGHDGAPAPSGRPRGGVGEADCRERRTIEYVEATLEDIEAANALSAEVLGRTLDELPPQTRALLKIVRDMVRARCEAEGVRQSDCRFTRRDVREASGWGQTQLRVHLGRLQELEYLIPHLGQRGRSYVYELAYDGEGEDGEAFVMGLVDTERLRNKEGRRRYDTELAGSEPELAASSRPQGGGMTAPSRGENIGATQQETTLSADPDGKSAETPFQGPNASPSYTNGIVAPL